MYLVHRHLLFFQLTISLLNIAHHSLFTLIINQLFQHGQSFRPFQLILTRLLLQFNNLVILCPNHLNSFLFLRSGFQFGTVLLLERFDNLCFLFLNWGNYFISVCQDLSVIQTQIMRWNGLIQRFPLYLCRIFGLSSRWQLNRIQSPRVYTGQASCSLVNLFQLIFNEFIVEDIGIVSVDFIGVDILTSFQLLLETFWYLSYLIHLVFIRFRVLFVNFLNDI